MRGFLLGSLALIALETLIRRADNAGALLTGAAGALERLISPEVGGVPDLVGRRTAAAAKKTTKAGAARNVTVTPYVPASSTPTGAAGLGET